MAKKIPHKAIEGGESVDILSFIPMGEQNKVRSADLADRCGFGTIRQLQERIERLRRSGIIICSSVRDGGGYYRPTDPNELRRYVVTCQSRALNSLASLSAARKQLRRLEREIADQTMIAELGE